MEEQMKNGEEITSEQYVSSEAYGYSGDPFEGIAKELCKRCGTRYVDYSENSQSVLCKNCREEMMPLKISKPVIAFCIFVVIATLLNAWKFTMDFAKIHGGGGLSYAAFMSDDRCKLYKDMADEGKVITAMDSMVEILESEPQNYEMAITLADVAMEYDYPDYVSWAIGNFLLGKEEYITEKEIDRLNEYVDEINLYYDTDELTSSICEEVYESMEDPAEDYYAMMLLCHDGIAAYIGNDDYDQALLEYQCFYFCTDPEEQLEHLENCIAANENYYDAQAQLAVYYRRNGDLDKARKILSAVYKKNCEDYAVLRAYAALELTEGNMADALSYAKEAYEMYPEGSYVADTYIIALLANGQIEEADALIKEWEESGYYFEEDFYSYYNGEMTLEEYYIGE